MKPTVLVILDGFGYSKEKKYNAITQANTPHFDAWLKEYPHTLLQASGAAVGLLPGIMGNSEVGHLTIGSGKIIPQDVVKIHQSIDDGSFFSNPVLQNSLQKLAQTQNALHLMGLLSDAGVHSHQKHLYALLQATKNHTIKKVFIHAFLDGRDTPPQSAQKYLKQLDEEIKKLNIGSVATISGRFYAMDRDNNWERTQKCYNALTTKQEISFEDWQAALDFYYEQNITDEFIPPTQLNQNGLIKNNDGIIFFNFRPDRARQLTASFVEPHFNHFPTKNLQLQFFITATNYNGNKYPTEILFKKPTITNTLKDILQETGKSMFSIAETEKYAHITYFFSGGKEEQYHNETRILVPSIPTKNYINFPEMSAKEITKKVLHSLQTDPKDFYLINYANADMVAHSGNFQATVKAIECLDTELQKIYEQVVEKMDGTLYITADHGNAEEMFDPVAQQPKTAHTTNPVYFLMIRKNLKNKKKELPLQGLKDITPFILENIDLKK